jgi:hypothetical protein
MLDKWQCRWSPTLGELESTHQEVWGTDEYRSIDKPTVFFGLYGFPDFYVLWRHRGRKAILWTGSDIRHFIKGYWLDDEGRIKVSVMPFAQWIRESCESWVENEVEYEALKDVGIESNIRPSFLGDIDKFEVNYKWSDKPKVYTSVSGDDFKLYAWDTIEKLAKDNPDIEFHLYGNTTPYLSAYNVIDHGRVPKEQMNEEIKEMQGALRLLPFEGFSEIVAKSVLMGQYPVSAIDYSYTIPISEIGTLKDKKEANLKGREYYIEKLNKYPWTKERRK